VFTAGGTEADNLAVLGGARARARHGRHVVIGPTEHAGVREAARRLEQEGFEVEHAPLDAAGDLDLGRAAELLRADTVLVAQMLANNEFGSVYAVRELARLVRARAPRALLHVDAVQAFGKLDLAPIVACADTLAISGHKVHGPQGTGALLVAEGVELVPLAFGGGQEHGLRPGTENVAALVGFGRACELAADEGEAALRRAASLRARLVAGLEQLAGARVLEPGTQRLPTIVAATLDGVPAEVAMNHLDARGVVVGAGSACQSRKKELSPGLLALGLTPERAREVLRFSFARTTTEDDVERALAALAEVCRELAAVRS
jgi:cysteine desulfurase